MIDKTPTIATGVVLVALIIYGFFFMDTDSRPLFSRPSPQPMETPEPQMITNEQLNDQVAFEMIARAVESSQQLSAQIQQDPDSFREALGEEQTIEDLAAQLEQQAQVTLAEAQRIEAQVRDGAMTWHQAVLKSDMFKNDFEAMKQIAIQQQGLKPIIPPGTEVPVLEDDSLIAQ